MEKYLPYFVTVLCSLISGGISYLLACNQTKAEIQKLLKQHELDLEREQEKFKLEKEKMELEHQYQLALRKNDNASELGANVTNTLLAEAMKIPEVRQQFAQGVKNGMKTHKTKK